MCVCYIDIFTYFYVRTCYIKMIIFYMCVCYVNIFIRLFFLRTCNIYIYISGCMHIRCMHITAQNKCCALKIRYLPLEKTYTRVYQSLNESK